MSLTQQMSPYGGPPGGRRRTYLLAGLAAVVIIAVTVGITLAASGGRRGPSGGTAAPAPTRFGIPSPQPARSPTADPAAPLLLPHPARTAANGVPLGFPRTPEGAASAVVRWDPLLAPADEARQLDAIRTIGSPQFIQKEIPVLQEGYRKQPPQPDAWAISTPLGVQVTSADADRITVAILRSLQVGDSTGAINTVYSTGSSHLIWSGEDWQLDDVTDAPTSLKKPSSSDPRDIVAAGWKEFQLG